ncbi:MAG: hypothetical protein ACKOEZ_11030, partial [Spartobacteria bacterium]
MTQIKIHTPYCLRYPPEADLPRWCFIRFIAVSVNLRREMLSGNEKPIYSSEKTINMSEMIFLRKSGPLASQVAEILLKDGGF